MKPADLTQAVTAEWFSAIVPLHKHDRASFALRLLGSAPRKDMVTVQIATPGLIRRKQTQSVGIHDRIYESF